MARFSTDRGDYVVETDDPDFAFRVSKGGVTLEDSKTGRKYQLKVLAEDRGKGEFELEVSDADADLLQAVSGRGEDEIVEAIEEAVARSLLTEDPPPAAGGIADPGPPAPRRP